MYLGTLESDFARSIGILIAFSAIAFATQGMLLPQASYFGQVFFWGTDLIRLMHPFGLAGGIFALISIKIKNRTMQRIAFAFLAWFYMTFAFVLVWLVGLQAPSVVFSIMAVLISGAVYGYLTQKGKQDENIKRRTYHKSSVRESVPLNNQGIGIDEGPIERDNIRP